MPLDQGIARMGLFAFVFLLAFAGIVSLIDGAMLEHTTLRNYADTRNVISDWYGFDITGMNFSETWNHTLTTGAYAEPLDIGGRNMAFGVDYAIGYVSLSHKYGFNLWGSEAMDWYNRTNNLVSTHYFGVAVVWKATLDYEYSVSNSSIIFPKVICLGEAGSWYGGSSRFWVTVIFSFNTTAWDTPTQAWDNNALEVLIGINPENSSFRMDIWFLIGSLLTFNTIEVFGTTDLYAYFLNGLIVAPIFVAIIIFATAIFLEVLPF